ncbi:MAG: bifunctional pyr operon transcriptional regulator/uracil phosphoribosyltransferase PyrR [Erysipelotrichaceae bacterium]|jgi:pyrimidine operon attenuation protein/uracil phosphoribosyltransferase|nr:bifunctional pyr operon transcriptional regulator/uracil phosphoribosyltransferase PyrR [Erysipelotrichaceae bacterium]MCI1327077.1 bifunctional pyr operon transcriptional regulator/uracil phosphoribosyltransferase PyrR [Solobacterium sp.]MCH4043479.1 bifunctional pyr operon transcriptional regulator/uracil phosphoribosyltransferase PyrR [Erysipelotrichaceae bacterium]MCH4120701.1 bifunctional pyr operon transcriptional regulator/uracil phosphoribosyltransferase PyrR [Erysipelotrichaceae bact
MSEKTQIMDEVTMRRSLARMTHEIIERNEGVQDVVLMGVVTRGISLAMILQENIEKFEGVTVPVGHLDITLHRDDLSNEEKQKRSQESVFPCDITGKTVIIVDDVLYTGRTARAAMEAVITKGRPKYIQLAVLVDRGHRELPIRADFVGKNVPTAKSENVQVRLMDNDGENAVYIER